MADANRPFLSDLKTIRERARHHSERSAMTDSYAADRATVIRVLNEALEDILAVEEEHAEELSSMLTDIEALLTRKTSAMPSPMV